MAAISSFFIRAFLCTLAEIIGYRTISTAVAAIPMMEKVLYRPPA